MSNEQNPGLLGNIGDTVGKTVGGVSNTVGNTVGGLGSTVGNATSGLGETVSGATQGVGNTARSAGEGVKSNVASLGGQKQTGDNPLGLNRSAHVEGQARTLNLFPADTTRNSDAQRSDDPTQGSIP
ncbi:hypothetical protein E8E15_002687 [Penicillium rubens]|nr:hypothetical protein E8E15_002687 [Penicillium rubens]